MGPQQRRAEAVGVGLFQGKRLALLGAIVLGCFSFVPCALGLLACVPLGVFGEAVQVLGPVALFEGVLLSYLVFNQNVRRAFR